jgi:hypothetical protein
MEIFNKSKRQFTLSTGVLQPEKSISISEEEGSRLIKMYEGELIQIGNSKVEQENEKLKEKIETLEAQLGAGEVIEAKKRTKKI